MRVGAKKIYDEYTDKPEISRVQRYNLRHKERVKESKRKSAHKLMTENPQKYLYQQIKKSAKSRGIFFNLDPEDLIITDICPVTKEKIKFYTGTDGPMPYSISVDRVDNSKGYIKGNVRVISNRINSCKNDLSLKEIENLYLYSKGLI